ncbi:MAG: ParB/RepB/Spo0J family partition protein [Candidatus Bathyarchaeia archaeon]
MCPIAVKPRKEEQKDKDFTSEPDIQHMNPSFTGKGSLTFKSENPSTNPSFTSCPETQPKETEFTGKLETQAEKKDLTKIIPDFEQIDKTFEYDLKTELSQRRRRVYSVPIEFLEPLKNLTPRRHSEEKINLLAESIKKTGVLHNLIVTIPWWENRETIDKLSIVCGVGRFLAAQKVGLKSLTVELIVLRDLDEAYLLSVTENLERTELSKIEEADFYIDWINKANVPLRDIAPKIHRSESYIYNIIRLKSLPVKIQECIHNGDIPYSFGLSLLEIKDPNQQLELAKLVIEDKLTRAQLEAKIREVKGQQTLASMKLEVEKPQQEQTKTQEPSPIQKALSKPFIKQPAREIEKITETRKYAEPDWWLYNWKRKFENCEYQSDCGLCHLYNECHSMLVENIRKFGTPPKEHWKLIRFLYETARLSKDLDLMDKIKALEQAGFDSAEIKQEIQERDKKIFGKPE